MTMRPQHYPTYPLRTSRMPHVKLVLLFYVNTSDSQTSTISLDLGPELRTTAVLSLPAWMCDSTVNYLNSTLQR